MIGGAAMMLPLDPVLLSCSSSAPQSKYILKSGFIEPPMSARPHTWWHWMNGNISREGIRLDLEAMHEVGLGGVQLFDVECGIPHGPVNYGSKQWHEMVRYALETAEQLDLKLCFHNCPGWSSSGGPWITPETSMKQVVWSEKQLHGKDHHNKLVLEQPETIRDFYQDICVLAFPTPEGELDGSAGFRLEDWISKGAHLYRGSMVKYERKERPAHDSRKVSPSDVIPADSIFDLSDHMKPNGSLSWNVPKGNWTVVRFGYTITGKTNHPAPPEATGLECDKLSKKGAEAHWNSIVAKVIETAGELSGKTLDGILIDSYEAHSQNWTENFPEEFIHRRKYDLIKYLPCITGRVVDNIETSERFLWDFRRTVADLFVDNYYGHFLKLANKNGLQLYNEPYGRIGNFDELANATRGDIIMGEFWVNRYDFGMSYSSKLAASAAHVRGKKYVASETFTAGREQAAWISHPYSLKTLGDYFYCRGINRFNFHEFAHQPWKDIKPGMTMGPFGFQMNRGNTWWKQSSAWISYLSKTQYLLQQGNFVADFCYYFGENVPNTLLSKEQLDPVPPAGHDYDAFVTETLMEMKVKKGRLVLPGGMEYRLMVLPHFEQTIRLEVLQKIDELVRAGAVILGPKPLKTPGLTEYLDNDKELETLANEIWGKTNGKDIQVNDHGKGRVYWGTSVNQIFEDLKLIPDFQCSGKEQAGIEYIHRRTDQDEIYFISNQECRTVALECSFRVSGKNPEIWNPETGQTKKAAYYTDTGNLTTLSLTMEPAGSLFIVFSGDSKTRTHVLDASWNNKHIHEFKHHGSTPELKITEALYGVLNDPSKTTDVKEIISGRIRDNYLRLVPNRSFKYDPAPNEEKQLMVKYCFNGKTSALKLGQNEQIVLPDQPSVPRLPAAEISIIENGKMILQAWRNGNYNLSLSNGETRKIDINRIPDLLSLSEGWKLRFPAGYGAPDVIQLDHLISWTDHSDPGVQHFSGTATYEKTFELPSELPGKGQHLWIDLGRVYNIAEISVNGHNPVNCWKPPFRMDISDLVQPGKNRVAIKVTNLWVNRMIGDEKHHDTRPFAWNKRWRAQLPVKWDQWQVMIDRETREPGHYAKETGRYAFSTAKYFSKDDPLLESGLIGPVTILVQQTEIIN